MTDEQHEINDLADELDRVLPPGRSDAPPGDSHPMLDAAVRLANAPRSPMPPDVMARIQAKVLETHRQQVRAKPRPRVTSYTRYLAAASIVIVLFFAGFVPAMAGSVPGDLLYPVKTGLENVELALATSDEAQISVYLTHAERRSEEAHILLARGSFDESLVTRALDSMLDSAEAARLHPDLPDLEALGTRMEAVYVGLYTVLLEAQTRQLATPAVLAALRASLDTAREGGDLLLSEPPAPEATPEVVETDSPTATLTPTATPSPTSTFTDQPTVTNTPTATPSPTAEVTIELTAEVTEVVDSMTTDTTPGVTAIIRAAGPVNVRSGPGLDFAVIATLQPGVRVPLLGWNEDGTWLHIQLEDGRRGWIASTLSNLYDLASPAATSESGSQGNGNGNGGQGNNGGQGPGGDFGCEHPGNYCNAPGQTGDNPGQGNGQGQGQGQGGGKP